MKRYILGNGKCHRTFKIVYSDQDSSETVEFDHGDDWSHRFDEKFMPYADKLYTPDEFRKLMKEMREFE